MDRNGTASYTYDTLNRLIEAVSPLPTNPLETYNYDEVGNRLTSNQNGTSLFNVANQLLEDVSFTYQYDNNGNLTRKTSKTPGPFTSYEYDAENKLVRVVSNGTVVNYKYDGLGRRVEKEINDGVTTKVTRFIYDNEDILLELDGSNNITARYTHGPGTDEPLIMEKGGDSFFYHADGLGSITEITDFAGSLKQQYTYSSFGKIESQLDPNFIQPYTFTSREFDSESGLYFYRARYYDPSTGRFLQEDPLLRAGNPEIPFSLPALLELPPMLHPYTYVQNNPIILTDPFGLLSCNGRWEQAGSQRIALTACFCFWLCMPCEAPVIWGGDITTLPSTVGVMQTAKGGEDIKTGSKCVCRNRPGPETGCKCPKSGPKLQLSPEEQEILRSFRK